MPGTDPMRPKALLLPLVVSALLVAGAASPAEPVQAPSAEEARAFLLSLLVKSPYRLPASALKGEIRYRLRFETGQDWRFPDTGEQRAVRDDDGIALAVCDDCGAEAPPSPEDLQRYLAANAWVRSDDREIRAFARSHGRGLSVHTRMKTLTNAVRLHMTGPIDFRHYDDAVAALRNRSGDCTEYAVLLAAAARALKIPARVAHGLVYSGRMSGQPHVFSPHAWVQVWDGTRWTSYDAALGQFGAGHIALSIGDGSPEGARGVNRATRDLRVIDAVGIRRVAAGGE
jgi:transglutaminase-like putative cysteine protease